jgi:hypothetical protein
VLLFVVYWFVCTFSFSLPANKEKEKVPKRKRNPADMTAASHSDL